MLYYYVFYNILVFGMNQTTPGVFIDLIQL